MKKIIVILLVVFIVPLAMFSQTDGKNDSDSYGKWQTRFRVIAVAPSADDDIDGADVDISTAVVPELDFTYFFTENWAVELILATTKHDVDVNLGSGYRFRPFLVITTNT